MSTKEKQTKGNEVANQSQFDLTNLTQKNVPNMLEAVNKKLEELKGSSVNRAGTTKDVPGFDKKVSEFDKVEELIMAYSAIKNRAKCYAEVAEELEVSTKKYPFKLGGHTEEEWLEDIRFQLSTVKNKKDIERLETINKTLSKYLSTEDQMKKDLEGIASILNDE